MKQFVPDWWNDAKNHLQKSPHFATLINSYSGNILIGGDAFTTLLRSITGQQISVKAAASIYARLEIQCGKIAPQEVQNLGIANIKEQGYSQRKAEYIFGLANTFITNNWQNDDLFHADFATVEKDLISIRGIGEWTVQMFSMFYRGDTDVFPTKDLGIIKGARRLLFNDEEVPIQTIVEASEEWSPYRTAACWYLWRLLDDEPVQY